MSLLRVCKIAKSLSSQDKASREKRIDGSATGVSPQDWVDVSWSKSNICQMLTSKHPNRPLLLHCKCDSQLKNTRPDREDEPADSSYSLDKPDNCYPLLSVRTITSVHQTFKGQCARAVKNAPPSAVSAGAGMGLTLQLCLVWRKRKTMKVERRINDLRRR